jgi:hypothetical protein
MRESRSAQKHHLLRVISDFRCLGAHLSPIEKVIEIPAIDFVNGTDVAEASGEVAGYGDVFAECFPLLGAPKRGGMEGFDCSGRKISVQYLICGRSSTPSYSYFKW